MSLLIWKYWYHLTQKRRTIQAVSDARSILSDWGDIYGIAVIQGRYPPLCVRSPYMPTAGKITIGKDVTLQMVPSNCRQKELRQKRQTIGMIFQHLTYGSKTAYENVAFALRHSKIKQWRERQKIRGLWIGWFGWSCRKLSCTVVRWSKTTCSDVRALNDPRNLISDESTSAPDPKTTKQIFSLCRIWIKSLVWQWLWSPNEMQIVKDIWLCAVMQNGQLFGRGQCSDTFSNPHKKIWHKNLLETAAYRACLG